MLHFPLMPWFLWFSALSTLCWLYTLWKLFGARWEEEKKQISFIALPDSERNNKNNSTNKQCILSVYYKLGIIHRALYVLIYIISPTILGRRCYCPHFIEGKSKSQKERKEGRREKRREWGKEGRFPGRRQIYLLRTLVLIRTSHCSRSNHKNNIDVEIIEDDNECVPILQSAL